MSFSYQWKRDGVAIPGAIASTYAVTTADGGKIIICDVTNTNSMGSTTVSSSNSAAVPLASPVNTVAPIVSGTASVGSTLTVTSNGTWTGAGTITYTYRWRRNLAAIPGATSSTYVIKGDDGGYIDCLVKATNSYGFSEKDSNDIGPVTLPYILDSVSGSQSAWSVCRQLKTGITSPIRVRRSSDNAEANISFAFGSINMSSLTSFIGSSSAYITTIYDQSGNGRHLTQTVNANQPRIALNGVLDMYNNKLTAYAESTSTTMSVASSTGMFNFFHNGTNSSLFGVASYNSSVNDTILFTTQASTTGSNPYNATGVRLYLTPTLNFSLRVGKSRVADSLIPVLSTGLTPSPAFITARQYLYSVYIDADNATAASRSSLYVNGGSALTGNTNTATPAAGDAEGNAATFRVDGTSPLSFIQEIITFNTQPAVATMRSNINGYYQIY